MSERKVLNKYYPPDFDPSKIPRMKLAKNRQYTVRLMAPFNMRCVTCGEYIYKGKKFNARKEDVENETYLGIRIYRFYIKCTRCLQEISFKTDPKNTDYEIEAGATRNFMALKLAEEQARKEEEELREEEANNPMKLLENRTQQSRNEIELLESLEELKDLNRRHQSVDYDTMLQQFDTTETERQRQERMEREDEEYIKTINFKNKFNTGPKHIVTEEIIEEIKEDNSQKQSNDEGKLKNQPDNSKFKIPQAKSIGTMSNLSVGGFSSLNKNTLKNIVKRKTSENENNNAKVAKITLPLDSERTANENHNENCDKSAETKNKSGLALLSAYSDSSEESD